MLADDISPSEIRRVVLDQSYRAGVGHIGSALSVVEILAGLYGGVLRIPSPDDPERDRFILSKGHAALALYAVLALKGFFPIERLDTYCADGSLLGVHPERGLPGIDFSTGSLGHGLPVGTGSALAARLQGSARRVFVLLSDAELNEGSTWEAVMFAAHHRLANLAAVVDVNGQQALGSTRDVLDLSPLAERFRIFGWDVVEVDGHDREEIRRALSGFEGGVGPPRVVLARTILGKGVSFMEGQVKWHYWPMSAEEHRQALAEIEALS